MRIEGTSDFLSRIATTQGRDAVIGSGSPFVIRNGSGDILEISEIGKRLRFNSGNISKIGENNALVGSDPVMQLMNRSLTDVEKILAEMKELAESAQDEKLSMVDRLNMQIEMEELREKLYNSTNAMSDKFAEMSGQDMANNRSEIGGETVQSGGGYDVRSLLERARDRAANGEEWNIAEKGVLIEKLEGVLVVKDGETQIFDVSEEEFFELPEGIDKENTLLMNIVNPMGSRYRAATEEERFDDEIPTVLERMEASGTIILTDAKSAKEGAKKLEAQLEGMKQIRGEFTEFAVENAKRSNSSNNGIAKLSSGGNSRKMSDGEISLLLGEIAREDEADRRRIENESNHKAYDGGADVNAAAKEAQEESASGSGDEDEFFSTELGTMRYTESGNRRPRLEQPDNPKGKMFAKIESFFDSLTERLMKEPISEDNYGEFDVEFTNYDPLDKMEKDRVLDLKLLSSFQ